MNKYRQAIEILYKVLNYEIYNGPYSKRLVIIEPRDTGLMGKSIGPYVSVMDLTAEDFLELYRYKKSLEDNTKWINRGV